MKVKGSDARIEMDYIYMEDGKPVFIETTQRSTREDIISRYVACRKAKKLTQAELAERSGMSRTNITRFESGKYNPSLEMLVKIAAAMEMKVTLSLETHEACLEVHEACLETHEAGK